MFEDMISFKNSNTEIKLLEKILLNLFIREEDNKECER